MWHDFFVLQGIDFSKVPISDEEHLGPFDDIRRFLKEKDPTAKIRIYRDIDDLNLGGILSLPDLDNTESILISEAFPFWNFPRDSFFRGITSEKGLLRLTPTIRSFQLSLQPIVHCSPVVYHGLLKGDSVRLVPKLSRNGVLRDSVHIYAGHWRTDAGRYCFTTSLGGSQPCRTSRVAGRVSRTVLHRRNAPPGVGGQTLRARNACPGRIL
ncbi:hypothetical protein HQ520_10780 [bacterium]|nr:hypothetical protein [bacterium]